jgi:uncharacterized membrane protein
VLVAASAVHVWFVQWSLDSRGAFDNDEVVSHLAVAGHVDDWAQVSAGGPPRGQWTSGEEIRRFLELDEGSSLGEVRQNLADYDYHPPLYYWAVHEARAAGLGLFRSGPAVNVVASILAGAVLFAILVEVTGRRTWAALATAVFALSPALLFAAALARHYVFLVLATTVLIWTTGRLVRSPRSPPLLGGLLAVSALGLLSASQFAYSLAGAVLLLVALGIHRGDRLGVVAPVASAAAGGLVALALHPGFGEQLARVEENRPGFSLGAVPGRLYRVVQGLADLVVLSPGADRHILPVAATGVVLAVATFPRWRHGARAALRSSPMLAAAVAIGGMTLVVTVALYALGRSPAHAVGRHYVVAFLPPLVVVVGALAARAARPALVLLAAVTFVGVAAWQWNDDYVPVWRHQRAAVEAVRDARLVVSDCARRGYTPGGAMWLQPSADFLLLQATDDPPPPLPAGGELSGAVLFHGDQRQCQGAGDEIVDQQLADLGLVRVEVVGPIGKLEIVRLEPAAGGGQPAATEASAATTASS